MSCVRYLLHMIAPSETQTRWTDPTQPNQHKERLICFRTVEPLEFRTRSSNWLGARSKIASRMRRA